MPSFGSIFWFHSPYPDPPCSNESRNICHAIDPMALFPFACTASCCGRCHVASQPQRSLVSSQAEIQKTTHPIRPMGKVAANAISRLLSKCAAGSLIPLFDNVYAQHEVSAYSAPFLLPDSPDDISGRPHLPNRATMDALPGYIHSPALFGGFVRLRRRLLPDRRERTSEDVSAFSRETRVTVCDNPRFPQAD